MNTITKYNLSFKYAVAFMRIFKQNIDENFTHIQNTILLLRENKQFFSKFVLFVVQKKNVDQAIKQFLHYFQLPDCFFLLATLLLKHNRFSLFFDVLECIKKITLDQNNQQEIIIYTAQALSEDDVLKIENLMIAIKKQSISKVTCIVSPDVIAGIRIVSNDSILDCSVRGQLVKLHTILKQEGIAYE